MPTAHLDWRLGDLGVGEFAVGRMEAGRRRSAGGYNDLGADWRQESAEDSRDCERVTVHS